MRSRITVYLSDAQLEYLRREAGKRRRSLSSYVTDCLLDYHVESSSGANNRSEIAPPFNALLRDTEDRIVAEIEKRTARTSSEVLKQVMVVATMLDRFVLSALVNTPEIPEAMRAKAVSSGERRYGNWREAVGEILDQIHAPHPENWRDGRDASANREDRA